MIVIAKFSGVVFYKTIRHGSFIHVNYRELLFCHCRSCWCNVPEDNIGKLLLRKEEPGF